MPLLSPDLNGPSLCLQLNTLLPSLTRFIREDRTKYDESRKKVSKYDNMVNFSKRKKLASSVEPLLRVFGIDMPFL